MSERLKEHAWKASLQRVSSRNPADSRLSRMGELEVLGRADYSLERDLESRYGRIKAKSPPSRQPLRTILMIYFAPMIVIGVLMIVILGLGFVAGAAGILAGILQRFGI